MPALAAIVFDFDGVIADCRRGVLLPGAAEFVRAAAQVVPLGIASGASTSEIEGILREGELRDAFIAVVGADRTMRSKPAPDPYLDALRQIQLAGFAVEARHTVAIDDSVWGLVAARIAGMQCVGIACDTRRDELLPHAQLVVGGLGALTLDTLDNLVRASSL